jgi:hypothetical protein
MRIDKMVFKIYLFFLLFLTALSGCITINNPNIPFAESIPELNPIERKNPLLAGEIRRLPDILDGLNDDERKALHRLTELFLSHPSDFETAFREMYKIGLPSHRKYCAPLQALLWVAMDSAFSKEKNPLQAYSLSNLLDQAWTFEPRLSPELILQIVASIKDPEKRKDFERDILEKYDHLNTRLLLHMEYSPEIFPEWVLLKMKELISNNFWSDYHNVLDRLNSPELVDYYVKNQINYTNYWEIASYNSALGDPHEVFRYKKGDCLYISAFIVKALQRNGYRAWIEKKPRLRPFDDFHAVCVFEIQGEKYIIDNGRAGPMRGIIRYNEY